MAKKKIQQMKTQLAVHEVFGQFRYIKIGDEIYFVGKDVAKILGYSNTRKAIIDHVDDEDKIIINQKKLQQMAVESKGHDSLPFDFNSPRGLMFINESGLYSLIFGSQLPNAKKFTRWVTSEVLPSIRKTGSYIMPSNPVPQTQYQKCETFSELIDMLNEQSIDFDFDLESIVPYYDEETKTIYPAFNLKLLLDE